MLPSRCPRYDDTSLRTQYVQLFVNGESLGLLTHVEDPGKRFLEAHGLDAAGTLYKAELFSFMPIDEATAQDAGKLNVLVEPEANADPEKFVRMVNAINDRSQDIR